MSMKNSNDTIENRTRNFRLVAQCLHLRHRVPYKTDISGQNMSLRYYMTFFPLVAIC
jgi:hypothetical protein